MLVGFRKFTHGVVAKVFFSLLAVGFVLWGISGALTMAGSNTAVAIVSGVPIDVSVVQAAYQTALTQASQQGQPDVQVRQQLASQALADAIRKQLVKQEEQSLGVVVPDAAVRQQLDAEPAFQTNGVFDKTKFTALLQQNNSSPDQFLSQLRDGLATRQLLGPLLRGVARAPELVNRLFALIGEQRVAALVTVNALSEAAPAAPSDDVLQRYWRNHPAQFTTPEYRRIKAVILSPALLAPHEQIPQADIDAAYARAAAAQAPSVAQRSVQVISVGDLASSSRLQAAWKKGASWDKMQALAKQYGASAVELDQAAQTQIPSAGLGQAVFAATVGKVTGPVAGDTGMYVFKVTAQSQSGPDAATVKAQVTQQLQLQKAQADVAQDVDALQDALAGQTPLDQLPGNLGLAAVQGTLDATGNTPDGTAAPIPGGDAVKNAIVAAAFAAHKGDPAQMINGPDGSYFAVTVDEVEAPALQNFAQARAKVLSAWSNDQLMRAAETQAAGILHAVQQGQSLTDVAATAGLQVSLSKPFTRGTPQGPDAQLAATLFTLKQGQAAMLPTGAGFTVAVLQQINVPDPAKDPADVQGLQQQLTQDLQNDVGESFLSGLQTRDKVTINQKMLAQIYQ